MNAIQRWWLYSFDDEVTGQRVSQAITVQPAERPIEDLWCRAKDVAELERVIAEQSERIEKLRGSVRSARAIAMDLDLKRESFEEQAVHLRDKIEGLHRKLDTLLAHCGDGECGECSRIICPHECVMHFHHDGCPACAEAGEPG